MEVNILMEVQIMLEEMQILIMVFIITQQSKNVVP